MFLRKVREHLQYDFKSFKFLKIVLFILGVLGLRCYLRAFLSLRRAGPSVKVVLCGPSIVALLVLCSTGSKGMQASAGAERKLTSCGTRV